MAKPAAVIRRDIIASTGPSIFGITRNTKLKNQQGEIFTFLGVAEGIVHLEREDKTKGEPFIEVDTSDMKKYARI